MSRKKKRRPAFCDCCLDLVRKRFAADVFEGEPPLLLCRVCVGYTQTPRGLVLVQDGALEARRIQKETPRQ